MTSREKILGEVKRNQPGATAMPDISGFGGPQQDNVQVYAETLTAIGGKVVSVENVGAVKALIRDEYDAGKRIVTTLPLLADTFEMYSADVDPHSFEDVELAVVRAHFAVAENGAVWLTDDIMGQRILPFICQHLAVIVSASSILPTMHEAYAAIGQADYGFGVFIGGPSKTADIEQSLVMGAHGPISMTVFVVREP